MKWAIAIAASALLAGCLMPPRHYDMPQVERDFKACMNATPAALSPIDFDNKVDACKQAAWASARARIRS